MITVECVFSLFINDVVNNNADHKGLVFIFVLYKSLVCWIVTNRLTVISIKYFTFHFWRVIFSFAASFGANSSYAIILLNFVKWFK